MPKSALLPYECELGSSDDSDDESVNLSDMDDLSEEEPSPTADAPKPTFRWHKDKLVVSANNSFVLDEVHTGTAQSNVDKLLPENTYARVLDGTGAIWRGIRSNSGTIYIIVDQDEEIISQFITNSKLPKSRNLRQITTIRFAEMSKAYYKDSDSSKLDPTMRALFGGGDPAVLLTTAHCEKILAQKAKRKRPPTDAASGDSSKRRATADEPSAAPIVASIETSGLSLDQQLVLNMLTTVCMPLIKAAKAASC
jgi:hypothetical protein